MVRIDLAPSEGVACVWALAVLQAFPTASEIRPISGTARDHLALLADWLVELAFITAPLEPRESQLARTGRARRLRKIDSHLLGRVADVRTPRTRPLDWRDEHAASSRDHDR